MTTLDDPKVNVKIRLAGLWAAIMIFYIYNDFFSLMVPGSLEAMMAGKSPFGPMRQEILLAFAGVIVIPNLMIPLSLMLKPSVNRWANIVVGVIYVLIIAAILFGASAWWFYRMLSVLEIALTAAVVWLAWTWPKRAA